MSSFFHLVIYFRILNIMFDFLAVHFIFLCVKFIPLFYIVSNTDMRPSVQFPRSHRFKIYTSFLILGV